MLNRDVSLTVNMNPDTYDLLVKWDWVGGPRRGGELSKVEVGRQRDGMRVGGILVKP